MLLREEMNRSELEAVQKLYEAHFDPSSYAAALEVFGDLFPDVRILIQVEELEPHRFSLDSVAVNTDEDAFKDYSAVAHINPFMDAVAAVMHTDRLYQSEEFIPRELVRKTEFFDAYLRPRDRMDAACGFNIFRKPDCIALFSATIPERLSEDDRAALTESLNRIRPYVQESFRMVRNLIQRTAVAQASSIIEWIGTPVAIFDAQERLVAQNKKAAAIFRAGDVLRLSREGKLCARRADASGLIEAAAASVLDGALPIGPLRIDRPTSAPLVLYFVPVGNSPEPNPIVRPFSEGLPAYMVYVIDPDDVDPAPSEMLASSLGLTRAEARLAQLLHEGLTVREAAESSSTAYATARNQLSSITRKLNLSRQSELSGLVARTMAKIPR
ncbi:hypothetical protein CLD20_14015 [Afifella sp. IM 167]|nr:hypothetical protein [Afifella sp. IM 167]